MVDFNLEKISDIEKLVWEGKIDAKSPISFTLDASLYNGINNEQTTFPFRLAYAIWVLGGSNLLRPLSYYGSHMDEMTDDGETLRGAYGPRMRFWIGPDALQEAININQDISEPEDFVKPVGLDQLEAVFKDFQSGMDVGLINLFDPALDFEETLYVPDLANVAFVKNDELDMVMTYTSIDVLGHLNNDVWLFEFIKWILATFLDMPCGKTRIVVCKAIFDVDTIKDTFQNGNGLEDAKIVSRASSVPQNITDKHIFWDEFEILQNFERHMRLQINDKTFLSEKVNVAELSSLLDRKLVSRINTQILKDVGYSLLICSLIKHADNVEIYNDFIRELIDKISSASFVIELFKYTKYCQSYYDLPVFSEILADLNG